MFKQLRIRMRLQSIMVVSAATLRHGQMINKNATESTSRAFAEQRTRGIPDYVCTLGQFSDTAAACSVKDRCSVSMQGSYPFDG